VEEGYPAWEECDNNTRHHKREMLREAKRRVFVLQEVRWEYSSPYGRLVIDFFLMSSKGAEIESTELEV
jgi:hypothetical protein